MNEVRPGEIYSHFKGKLYQIVTVAIHSESGEKLVIYQALYGEFKVYARPYDMFVSEVDHEKHPDVNQKMRFEKVVKNHRDEADFGINYEHKEHLSVKEREDKMQKRVSISENSIEDAVKEEMSEDEENEEEQINPALLEFLNADTYKEKLEVLSYMKDHIDARTLDSMAVAMDCVLPEGSYDEKYNFLIKCIKTHEKYELRRR